MAVFLIHGNHMISSNRLSLRDYNGQPDLVNTGFVRLFLNKKKSFFKVQNAGVASESHTCEVDELHACKRKKITVFP